MFSTVIHNFLTKSTAGIQSVWECSAQPVSLVVFPLFLCITQAQNVDLSFLLFYLIHWVIHTFQTVIEHAEDSNR